MDAPKQAPKPEPKKIPQRLKPTRNKYTRRAQTLRKLGCGPGDNTRIGAFADHAAGKINLAVGRLVVALSVDDAEQVAGALLTEAEEVERVIKEKADSGSTPAKS